MSLTIELSPVEEQKMVSFAHKAGLPVADFAHRLMVDALQQQAEGNRRTDEARRTRQERREKIAQAFAVSGITENELEHHAQQIVDEVRIAQYARDSQAQ